MAGEVPCFQMTETYIVIFLVTKDPIVVFCNPPRHLWEFLNTVGLDASKPEEYGPDECGHDEEGQPL